MLAEEIFENLIEEKKELEKQFISIGLHSIGISEYLVAKDQNWENISQWFHIANGIKDLNYDGINYDSGYFMCRPAYEYETARQELYQRLVKEITIFSYLYNGLEAIISSLKVKNCPNYSGKINAATYMLQQKFHDIDLPVKLYSETVKLLERMFQYAFDEEYMLGNELKNKCVSVHGIGLRMIYKVRNKIMHGDFFFPEPIDYAFSPPLEPEIIRLSSRLILLSVQMLLLSKNEIDSGKEIMIYNSSIINSCDYLDPTIKECHYLKAFHSLGHFSVEQIELNFK